MSGSNQAIGTTTYSKIINNKYVKIIYSDLNSNYTVDNLPLNIYNANAVSNELLNLITTVPGEFDFEPDFGCKVPLLIFNLPSQVLSWMIENYLFVAVDRWMPFVHIDFTNSLIAPLQSSAGYYFRLVYSVDNLGSGNLDFSIQG